MPPDWPHGPQSQPCSSLRFPRGGLGPGEVAGDAEGAGPCQQQRTEISKAGRGLGLGQEGSGGGRGPSCELAAAEAAVPSRRLPRTSRTTCRMVPGAQQSPSVAMATSISLLPISSKALARLLRSPSSCCSASQRSRITPVGLALVAK